MREDALRARRRRRFRKTTQSNHTHPVAPNLLERRFDVGAPNRAWVSDLSYVWTLEGWLYLCVILDLFSRRVIGWSMDSRIDRHLTLSALRMALANREVSSGLVHHSDRGSQYAAGDYRKVLRAHGLECSMSRKGDCWDNAVVESFFATLKVELIYRSAFATRKEARQAIFDYIEAFYNRRRRHSYLGFLSPVDFEGRGTKLTLAA
jgi:transposase InsO family protein